MFVLKQVRCFTRAMKASRLSSLENLCRLNFSNFFNLLECQNQTAGVGQRICPVPHCILNKCVEAFYEITHQCVYESMLRDSKWCAMRQTMVLFFKQRVRSLTSAFLSPVALALRDYRIVHTAYGLVKRPLKRLKPGLVFNVPKA